MSRWWIYQKERFPVFAHGPLIAAFSACAVAFSSMLRGAAPPQWQSYLTAFGVCLLMFFQLRIADEFKDREEDARWRPYRPVPRGLVKLSELRVVFIIAALLQIALVLAHDFRLLLVLAAAWTYFTLMSVEFFCRDWLKARPVVYLLTHMGIMPLVDFFGTACEWLPRGASAPSGLGWFLTASGGLARGDVRHSRLRRHGRRAHRLCPAGAHRARHRARSRPSHPPELSGRPASRQAHRVTHRTLDAHTLSHVRCRAAVVARVIVYEFSDHPTLSCGLLQGCVNHPLQPYPQFRISPRFLI
ncbi:MAG: UbiA family prenyltransferase [Akkermansiaceae bacterium]|nr:UbiA family prenyltransferase [Akkermansiaceae bacterium]